jgi:ankyrin repeat protein
MSANSEKDININFLMLCIKGTLEEVTEYFNLNYDLIDVNYVYLTQTNLIIAIGCNTYDVIEYLITVCGANVNSLEGAVTPLMCAVISNNVELVKLLLANDADPNIKNQYNQTPLERARKENRTEIIAILESPMIKSANKV